MNYNQSLRITIKKINFTLYCVDGYGNTLLNVLRKTKSLSFRTVGELDLPLTLGRDFAGIVVSKGHNVGDRLEIGKEVWGVVPIAQQGCHANYVIVDSSLVRHVSFLIY